MSNEEQLAQSLKYSSAFVWHFAEISPGLFALYNYKREVVLTTEDWSEILSAYRVRPPYIKPAPPAKTITGLDISTLEFRL